jgi:Ca-activated chloride channel family protein
MAAHDIRGIAGRLATLGLLSCITPGPADAQAVRFRSGVDMVPLTVTVTNGDGDYVTGLSRANFTVLEDGVPQPLSFFSGGTVPVDVLLVLDTSSSMTADMPHVRAAATGLIRSLRPGDRGAVLAVKSSVAVAQSFTGNLDDIVAAIEGLPAAGLTAVYDGLYIALRELVRERRAQTEVRRQVLVLLSDGVDNASHVSAEEIADFARRVGASIYAIALTEARRPASRTGIDRVLERAVFDMRALATETGGRAFRPARAAELPGIYGAIAKELGSQYDLGYVPVNPADKAAFRRVAVRVLPPNGAVARTRSGYYADRGPLSGRDSIGMRVEPR